MLHDIVKLLYTAGIVPAPSLLAEPYCHFVEPKLWLLADITVCKCYRNCS